MNTPPFRKLENPVDWNKPIQTRDGRKARVICRDADMGGGFNYICLIHNGTSEHAVTYLCSGHTRFDKCENVDDVINVPEEHEIEVKVCKYCAEDRHSFYFKDKLCISTSVNCSCEIGDNSSCKDWKLVAKKTIKITEGAEL
jgi:hypothetical protein